MHRWRSVFLALVFTAFPALCHAGGKAGDAAAVSFHIETEGNENPKMVAPFDVGGQQRFFRRMPEVSMKDFSAFSPFPSDDGQTYGVVFQLKAAANRRLSAITQVNQGKMLIAQVNGRVVDAVIIDKPVNDGLIVIWKGITDAEIKQYDKVAPRIGAEDKKKKR